MEITAKKIKEIFDTLPTGYYLGRRIEVVFSETSDASFYEPLADRITISAKMIIDGCKSVEEKDVEEVVRGLLYHEVSHAILTGKTGSVQPDPQYMNAINILEDERIETLLKDYYMNTDFYQNAIRINNFNGEEPVDANDAFYQLVRFHIGPNEWLEKLGEHIDNFSDLDATSRRWEWENYFDECENFYKAFCNDFKYNPEKFKTPNANSDDNSNANGDEDAPSENSLNENASNENVSNANTSNEQTNKSVNDNTTTTHNYPGHGLDKSAAAEKARKVFGRFSNSRLKSSLYRILNTASYKKGMLAGAVRCYNGHIDPMACGRDDYKWFTKNTGDGDVNGISKIHFNLFIDNSGSFDSNTEQINEFLKALNAIKSPTFDFDVITINDSIFEWPTSDYQEFEADGGTELSNEIEGVIKKHTQPNAQNFNIVVFDGRAHRRCGVRNEPFRHFDTPNSILVVDSDNESFIANLKNCKKKIIHSNYAGNFINEVLRLLESIIC